MKLDQINKSFSKTVSGRKTQEKCGSLLVPPHRPFAKKEYIFIYVTVSAT